MMVLVSYDVNTEDSAGARRLRKVAKACVNKGQRVQNSVFECLLDYAEYKALKIELEKLIDPKKDSLRFYNLGDKYSKRIETLGRNGAYDPEGLLIV
ncbi:MAG: CRISPR-associated endonuclease Cas2 [Coriobacteriia bacterium]|nr:CRISPR-associated endonuclease Cas2 [Coriobacteriia bacterium]